MPSTTPAARTTSRTPPVDARWRTSLAPDPIGTSTDRTDVPGQRGSCTRRKGSSARRVVNPWPHPESAEREALPRYRRWKTPREYDHLRRWTATLVVRTTSASQWNREDPSTDPGVRPDQSQQPRTGPPTDHSSARKQTGRPL